MFSASTKNNISNDLKIGANRIKDDVRQTSNSVSNDLEFVACDAGKKIRNYFDDASEEISEVVGNVKGQIRNNPIQSSLVALTAGFIIGALFRR